MAIADPPAAPDLVLRNDARHAAAIKTALKDGSIIEIINALIDGVRQRPAGRPSKIA
jgi:hypothetical protein